MVNKKDFDDTLKIIDLQTRRIDELTVFVKKQEEELSKLKKIATFLSKFKQDEVEIYHSFNGWKSTIKIRYLYNGELVEFELPNISPFSYQIVKENKDSVILYSFVQLNTPVSYYKLDKHKKAVVDITAEYKELQEAKAKKQTKSAKKK